MTDIPGWSEERLRALDWAVAEAISPELAASIRAHEGAIPLRYAENGDGLILLLEAEGIGVLTARWHSDQQFRDEWFAGVGHEWIAGKEGADCVHGPTFAIAGCLAYLKAKGKEFME